MSKNLRLGTPVSASVIASRRDDSRFALRSEISLDDASSRCSSACVQSAIFCVSATSDAIVYEQGGDLYVMDLASKQARKLTIDVAGDFPWARTQPKKVASMIRSDDADQFLAQLRHAVGIKAPE